MKLKRIIRHFQEEAVSYKPKGDFAEAAKVLKRISKIYIMEANNRTSNAAAAQRVIDTKAAVQFNSITESMYEFVRSYDKQAEIMSKLM